MHVLISCHVLLQLSISQGVMGCAVAITELCSPYEEEAWWRERRVCPHRVAQTATQGSLARALCCLKDGVKSMQCRAWITQSQGKCARNPAHPDISPTQPPIEDSVTIMKKSSQHADIPSPSPTPSTHHYHITHGSCCVVREGVLKAEATPGMKSSSSAECCKQIFLNIS